MEKPLVNSPTMDKPLIRKMYKPLPRGEKQINGLTEKPLLQGLILRKK
jgi:hypothetical protein